MDFYLIIFFSLLIFIEGLRGYFLPNIFFAEVFFIFGLYFFLAPNESFANILLMIVSSLSTSGISFDRSNSDLSLFLIFLTIIGGSVASTSSGFKYLRIYIILKNSIQEILRLSKPMYVFNKTLFRSKYTISEDDISL